MGRAPCCDKTKVKRGPWSPEEDATLKTYLQTHGTGGNWIALPHKAGLKRCGKSCRLRWLNYLRPNIKHGGFTEEEDNIIFTLYSSLGSRWSLIASQLPGRTDNDIKNYWNTKLKKKLLSGQVIGAKKNSNYGATNPTTTATNNNNNNNKTTEAANMAEFSSAPSNPKLEIYNPEDDENSIYLNHTVPTTLPPLMETGYLQQQYIHTQSLILNQIDDQLPLITSPFEVSNFGTSDHCNSYNNSTSVTLSSSKEFSGLSTTTSSYELLERSPASGSAGGSMIPDDGILLQDFGFDQSSYELLKGLGF